MQGCSLEGSDVQVGSIFEILNKNSIFGVLPPSNPLWLPILGTFAATGLPSAGKNCSPLANERLPIQACATVEYNNFGILPTILMPRHVIQERQ